MFVGKRARGGFYYGNLVKKWMECGFVLMPGKKERRENAKLPKLAFVTSTLCHVVYETAFSLWALRQLWLSLLKAVKIT